MALDYVTAAYRAGAAYSRTVPRPMAEFTARGLSRAAASLSKERRMMVARHLQRAAPQLQGRALDRAVDATFGSYARYWVDSFRLPKLSVSKVDEHFDVAGYDYVTDALRGGNGVLLALPHLGGWDWAGFWLTQVQKQKVTVVVEPLEPPALFDFFADFRRQLGMNIVPLGPDAGKIVLQALADNHIVCLLSDRDIRGDGIELEFFNEVTTLPAGPATLAMRTGATLLSVGVYFEGKTGHAAVVEPPIDCSRQGKFRADVTRITTDLARRLEGLIRKAPEQWHLQQPNWPSDYEALEVIGKPHPRPPHGPAAKALS